MEPLKFDYKIIRAELFLNYGIDLDETSASILFILLDKIDKNSMLQIKKLNLAADSISTSQKSLQVDTEHYKSQAFWYGVGNWGFALFMAVLISSSLYIYTMLDKKAKEEATSKYLFYKNYYEQVENKKRIHN